MLNEWNDFPRLVRFYFVIEVTSVITEMFFSCRLLFNILYLISECSKSARSFSPASRNETGTCLGFENELKHH